MEQGYAKFTGPRDESEEWANRARGWMKVLQVDAWASAGVYTFATIAFYLLGAAILGRIDLQPQDSDMVRSLGVMYRPVFGETAGVIVPVWCDRSSLLNVFRRQRPEMRECFRMC